MAARRDSEIIRELDDAAAYLRVSFGRVLPELLLKTHQLAFVYSYSIRQQSEIRNTQRDIIRIPAELNDKVAWLRRLERIVEDDLSRMRGMCMRASSRRPI